MSWFDSRLPALVSLALLATGCGYVGDPLPPLANVPARVTDLDAVQRGSRIIARFTMPSRTTEAVAIKSPLKVDLRVASVVIEPFNAGVWAAEAQPVPEGGVEEGSARYEIPSAPWAGKVVTIAVRVIGSNGKASDWSEFVNLPVVLPPVRPAAIKAVAAPEGVRLTWEGPAGDFRVFRRAAEDKTFSPAGDVEQLSWTDHATEYGKLYTYIVQRIVKLPAGRHAESEPSEQAAITPQDTFPPAAPAGLRAVPALNSIEISWERNSEPDLAAYRVYRALSDGDLEKVADVSLVPSYSDRKVERGKTYRYSVTALDKSGNESPRSIVVESTLL